MNYITNSMKISYANQGLTAFQNNMVKIYGSDYSLKFGELQRMILAKEPDFLLSFGESVATAGYGKRRLNESMERVAEKSENKKLPNLQNFQQGLIDEGLDFDFGIFGDSALDVATDMIKNSGEIVGNLGSGAKKASNFLGTNIVGVSVALGAAALIGGAIYLKSMAK